MSRATPDSTARAASALTPREEEILALLAEGLDDKTIAARLGLKHGSVRNRLTALYRKLGVTSRTAAALHALARPTGLAAAAERRPSSARHRTPRS